MGPTKPLFSTFYRILGVQRRLNLTKAIKPIFKSSKTLETSHNWEAYSRFACVKPGRVGGGGLVLTVSPSTSKSSFYISPQGYNPSVYDHWFSGKYSTSPYKDQMSEMEEWVMQRKLQSSAGLFPSQTSGQDTFCYTETHLPSGDGNSCTNKNNFNRNGHEKRWS